MNSLGDIHHHTNPQRVREHGINITNHNLLGIDGHCQNAFEKLIETLTTAPVLGFVDPKKPYILHTDASTTGLGVNFQESKNVEQLCTIHGEILLRGLIRYCSICWDGTLA